MSIYDDIRRDGLYEKLLFIVGNARSVTTIIANILNMSERIYVMEEANLFTHLTRADFPKWFRLRQTSPAAAFDFGREHNAEIGTALGGCDVIYRDLRNMFSPLTLQYQAPEQPFGLIGSTIQRIAALQDRLVEGR